MNIAQVLGVLVYAAGIVILAVYGVRIFRRDRWEANFPFDAPVGVFATCAGVTAVATAQARDISPGVASYVFWAMFIGTTVRLGLELVTGKEGAALQKDKVTIAAGAVLSIAAAAILVLADAA